MVVIWLGVCASLLVSARNDANEGLDRMDEFNSLASEDIPTFIDTIGGRGTSGDSPQSMEEGLKEASESFTRAHDSASSPILLPLHVVPVVGRQIRSVSALSGAAATTTAEASTAVSSLSAILDRPADEAHDRLQTTGEVQKVLTTLQDSIKDLDLGPEQGLVAPLADARTRFSDEYDKVLDNLDTAVVGVTGVQSFLQGPNRYLVLAANNGEMRAGSGMFLQIGPMDIEDGTFSLGEFEATADLKLDQPGATLDPDLEALWGDLQPTQDWRNLNVTPRFDESARMAGEMWESMGRGPVDGVLAIDILGLERLLKVTGPVEIDTVDGPLTISVDNVRSELLLDQYANADDDITQERRAQLGRVAKAVFEKFNGGTLSATDLLQVLRDSGQGRHLMLWSSDPTQQAAWEALGASGKMVENDMMVSVLNRAGNKLDQFLQTSSVLSATTSGKNRRMQLDVTLTNVSPDGLPRYVGGPYPGTTLSAGDYQGLLSITVPGGAGNPSVTGAELAATGQDGPNHLIVVDVLVPKGQTLDVTVEFDLPTSWTTIDIQPTARVPAMEWTAGDATWKDHKPHEVDLDTLD